MVLGSYDNATSSDEDYGVPLNTLAPPRRPETTKQLVRCPSMPQASVLAPLSTLPPLPPSGMRNATSEFAINHYTSPERNRFEAEFDEDYDQPPLSAYRRNRLTRQKRSTNINWVKMDRRLQSVEFDEPYSTLSTAVSMESLEQMDPLIPLCQDDKENMRLERGSAYMRDSRRRTAARFEKRKANRQNNNTNTSDEWDDCSSTIGTRRVQFARERSMRRKTTKMGVMQSIDEHLTHQSINTTTPTVVKTSTTTTANNVMQFNASPYRKSYTSRDGMKRRPVVHVGHESERSLIERSVASIPSIHSASQLGAQGQQPKISPPSNATAPIVAPLQSESQRLSANKLTAECGFVYVGAMAEEEIEKENWRDQCKAGNSNDEDDMGLPAETNSSREMKVFKRVLRDPALRKPFHMFLEQQFCAENLNFYVAVEQFHDLPHESTSRAAIENRELVARRIFERHFAPNSMEPVNVDNSTSKRIREMIHAERYVKNVYDVAQYQIFHLLKYDCWPRFLRAGGIAPEFSDEELADDEGGTTSGTGTSATVRTDTTDESSGSTIVARHAASEDQPSSSGQQPTKDKHRSWATHAFSVLSGASPNNSLSNKDKRRSLLWHGFDRFSRKLKKDGCTRSSGGAGSPVCDPRHSGVHRTSSSRAGGSHEEPRRSYSSEMDDDRLEDTVGSRQMHISSAGSRRRHMFTASKQFSMPAEISHPNSPSPLRPAQRVVCKFCTLMSGDSHSSETVELNDPSISVGRWTQLMATEKGMDRKCTEAVDAQTGSTIDPCRQALDALQNRFVRLVPVVTFAVEILPPNFSFKSPQSTPSKVVMLRARHSLSAGAALRPLLAKYSIDFGSVVVVFGGTLDCIRPTVTIGLIGPRSLTIMSQQQFQDRQQTKDRIPLRDPIISSPNMTSDHGLQFHQHGDISYCELPSEAERARGMKGEHSLSLMKFMRKASAAVTSKDDGANKDAKLATQKSTATGIRRRSVGQTVAAGVYCGEDHQPAEPHKEPAKKRLSIFKNNKGKECSTSTESKQGSSADTRSPQPSHSRSGTSPAPSPREANGDTPRTPAIYASKVCVEGEEGDERSFGWQTAAYV